MSNNRKNIRVTIPSDMIEKFNEAKSKAESAVMMKMTDTQYATRLILWAIEHNK